MPVAVRSGRRERPTSTSGLAAFVAGAAPSVQAQFRARVATLLGALDHDRPGSGWAWVPALELDDPATAWLALAVLTGELPDRAAVLEAVRKARLDGNDAALTAALQASGALGLDELPDVQVVRSGVVVDVHHTSHTELATGIQRVVRETVGVWQRTQDIQIVGWTGGYRAFTPLRPEQLHGTRQASAENAGGGDPGAGGDDRRVVPWQSVVVVPELAAERERTGRYQALARYSGCRTGVIGFDCVPMMASETAAEGMPGAFSRYLAAIAHFDRLAAISLATTMEYRAWRSMLAGSGRQGPEIATATITVEAKEPSASALAQARDLLLVGSMPVVLVVGSHEPRKNHLAVLFAAEALWREGVEFSLTFVGGNSWKSDDFTAWVEQLQQIGRPVQTLRALPDDLLWAAYRVAYCTVFVSVHEGFGLPVAESLASGTPVITSNIGSMLDIASRGGALTVDPFDDDAIAGTLRRLLQSPGLRARLAGEAASLTWRSWEEYAAEVWTLLVSTQ